MDKVTQDRFNRVDQDLRAVNETLRDVNHRLYEVGQDLGEIKGSIKPRGDVHWAIRFVAAPLLVLLVGGCATLIYRSLDKRLSAIEKFITDNGGFVAGLQLQRNASNPTDPANIQEAQRILVQAKSAKLRIPPDVVESAGKQFITSAPGNSDAWTAALQFVNYRSFLNADTAPKPQGLEHVPQSKGPDKYNFSLHFIPIPKSIAGTTHPIADILVQSGPQATKENCARVELLTNPESDVNSHAVIVVIDAMRGKVILDNQLLKHVVIKNAIVSYEGGATLLEDVYFVDCKFELPRVERTINFATAILSSSSVSFRT